jgi:hypothetical protein
MNKFKYLAAAAAIVAPASAYAQETTSQIRGNVTSAGAPVAGAEVVATHVPSGTIYRATTGNDGTFQLTGLRIGGPFTLSVTAPGLPGQQVTDIFLVAGQAFRAPIELAAADATTAADIVVTAQGLAGAGTDTLSPTTTLRRDDIEGVASINRDVRDLVRRSPFAQLDPTNARATSIAGQNPRFNRFSVDGVQFSDDFGLNNGGLPTSRGPVPLDAICEFTVEVAPVDIAQGDFQGGAINTQLCSGTNRFTGGVFYTYNDDRLTGDNVRGTPVTLDVKNEAYGLFFRGPILRDRLFFAVAWERTRETEPALFGPVGEGFANQVNISRARISEIQQIANQLYGFDPGDFPASIPEADDRVTARLDFNINPDHNLAVTYIFNDGSQAIPASMSTATGNSLPRAALFSNAYTLTERVHSGVVQLNSRWSNVFSTEARVSYRDYKRGQTPPLGRDFGQFTVCLDPTTTGSLTACTPGAGVVVFGPDISRQANELATTNFDAQLTANFNLGAHNIKAIFGYTEIDIYNLFLQRATGAFYFDSLADFRAGRASQLDLAQSTTGDIRGAAADFRYRNFTLGIQDSWDITDNLLLVAGVRYEMYAQNDQPARNPFFTARYGFSNQQNLSGLDAILPRIGVSWRPAQRLNLRATLGRYAAGTPDVWISNSYSNTGVTQNRVTINRIANAPGCSGFAGTTAEQAALCNAALLNVFGAGPGIPGSVTGFIQNDPRALALAGVNAIDPNFDLPVQWRLAGTASYNANLGPLGDDWFFAVDALYGWVDKAIDYRDLRSVQIGTAPDGRPRYGPFPGTSGNNSDLLMTNSDEGHSLIVVGRFAKDWANGFSLGAAYTWMDIRERSPLTSSVAFSNYQNQPTADPNRSSLGIGNEQTRHSVKWNLGFRREFFRDAETRIDLFGEWRTGRPFSYTFDSLQTGGRDPIFGVFGADNRHLLYVPTGPNDPLVSYDSAATQAALEGLIGSTRLRDYRGRIAGKNIGRSPNFTQIDMRISQTIPTFGFGRVKLFADMENLLNFIDRDWGSLRQVSFPFSQSVVDVQCLSAPVPTGTAPGAAQIGTSSASPCAQYRYSAYRDPNINTFTSPSLWAIRLGVRFEF